MYQDQRGPWTVRCVHSPGYDAVARWGEGEKIALADHLDELGRAGRRQREPGNIRGCGNTQVCLRSTADASLQEMEVRRG